MLFSNKEEETTDRCSNRAASQLSKPGAGGRPAGCMPRDCVAHSGKGKTVGTGNGSVVARAGEVGARGDTVHLSKFIELYSQNW